MFHFVLYIVQEKYDFLKVASEIVLRFYLTIGFVGLVALIALGLTSTDAMIRKLAPRWNTLHKIVYAIGVLAILHFMLQKKLEIYEPVLMFGLMLWLFGYRMFQRYAIRRWLSLIALSIVSAIPTALLEAGWYATNTGRQSRDGAAGQSRFQIRHPPHVVVLAAGLGLTAVSFAGALDLAEVRAAIADGAGLTLPSC